MLLWRLRHEIIEPFGESAQDVFAKISAWRNKMSGEPVRALSSGVTCMQVEANE
jgi:hypothetical protein